MRAENFTWSDGIYLAVQGKELDLHNNYDFRSFAHDVESRTLSLTWHRRTGEGVDRKLPPSICIEISEVHHIKVRPRDPEMPFTEDDCLASFGYDCDENWVDGQFWVDGPVDPNWRWSFLFQSGAEIIVGADRAEVTLGSEAPAD